MYLNKPKHIGMLALLMIAGTMTKPTMALPIPPFTKIIITGVVCASGYGAYKISGPLGRLYKWWFNGATKEDIEKLKKALEQAIADAKQQQKELAEEHTKQLNYLTAQLKTNLEITRNLEITITTMQDMLNQLPEEIRKEFTKKMDEQTEIIRKELRATEEALNHLVQETLEKLIENDNQKYQQLKDALTAEIQNLDERTAQGIQRALAIIERNHNSEQDNLHTLKNQLNAVKCDTANITQALERLTSSEEDSKAMHQATQEALSRIERAMNGEGDTAFAQHLRQAARSATFVTRAVEGFSNVHTMGSH